MAGNPPWSEWLKHLLCRMYEFWGGNCAELGVDNPECIATLVAEYENSGPPEFDTPDEENEFTQLLDAVDAHLALPENSLAPADHQALVGLISALRGLPVD